MLPVLLLLVLRARGKIVSQSGGSAVRGGKHCRSLVHWAGRCSEVRSGIRRTRTHAHLRNRRGPRRSCKTRPPSRGTWSRHRRSGRVAGIRARGQLLTVWRRWAQQCEATATGRHCCTVIAQAFA